MNERILDICIKAGINTWPFNEVGFISLDESELKKFAELIVRECVSVINTEAAEHEDDDEIERAWKMGTEFAVYQIKQHFGVEL